MISRFSTWCTAQFTLGRTIVWTLCLGKLCQALNEVTVSIPDLKIKVHAIRHQHRPICCSSHNQLMPSACAESSRTSVATVSTALTSTGSSGQLLREEPMTEAQIGLEQFCHKSALCCVIQHSEEKRHAWFVCHLWCQQDLLPEESASFDGAQQFKEVPSPVSHWQQSPHNV